MQIKLKNLDPEAGTLTVKGPQVEFGFTDGGTANVTIALSVRDGTHFFYPDGSGKALTKSTTLPKGSYECALVINAFDMEVFGRTYKSKVSINGVTVATTNGAIPDGEKRDSDFQFFGLVVK